jgi:hypothetical protein
MQMQKMQSFLSDGMIRQDLLFSVTESLPAVFENRTMSTAPPVKTAGRTQLIHILQE